MNPDVLDRIDFSRNDGFVTVVAQDATTGRVLMVARADREAMSRTIETGEMHYHSRQRGLWHKGASSGNRQCVVSLHVDCDGDAVLALVTPDGPSCHTGDTSCFAAAPSGALRSLDDRIDQRARAAEQGVTDHGYTRRLLADRNLRLKKAGEEAAEFVVACADGDRDAAVEEAADLLYHVLVALRALGAGVDDVARALERRTRPLSTDA
jgi:phosphoribosyl-ATP pyrophosphohydrolase/phosphoribosyl-AMP cyclohydrolase